VFVEVKTRSSETWVRPTSSVNPEKQRKIFATARDYLRLLDNRQIPIRYNIVEVLLEDGQVSEVRHQSNAFAPARIRR